MNLRSYQIEALTAIKAHLVDNNSTLLEMATGLGKTIIFASLADEWPGRVLVVAHRDELIRQAADKVEQITGHTVSIEMGRASASDALYGTKVTVASVQTLARAKRRERFHPDHFSLIVIDEGHHATAITYREVMEYFASAKKLLVTATPKRADQVALEHVCDTVAYSYGIEPAINDGWLVPVQQVVVKVEGLDFSKARTVAEDFNAGDLEKIMIEEKPLHAMVSSAVEIVGNRQCLWFCVSVDHAKKVAEILRRYTSDENVAFLSGNTPKDERHWTVEQYKKGKIQHLANCALFLEGFDAPTTSCIVMGRPTKSLGLYMQILGRGTRPLPGIVDGIETPEQRRTAIAMSLKKDMLVVDYSGNAGKHKIVQATDVLGGAHEPPVREYAKQILLEEDRKPVDLKTVLARAEAEYALEKEEDERRRKIVAIARYTTQKVDPFVRHYAGQISDEQGNQPAYNPNPATLGQRRCIWAVEQKLGRHYWTDDKMNRLTKKQASGIINKLKRE